MKVDDKKSSEIIVPLGKALKDARLTSALSIDDVAEKLNLGAGTVRDLEDELDNILASNKYPVIYLRGYLSNYAKLVVLSTLELFIEYQQLENSPKNKTTLHSSNLIIPTTKKRSKVLPISLLVIAVIVALFYLLQQPLLATFNKFNLNETSVSETRKTGTPLTLSISRDNSDNEKTAVIATINDEVEPQGLTTKKQHNNKADNPVHAINEALVSEPAAIESTTVAKEIPREVEINARQEAQLEATFDAFEATESEPESLNDSNVELEVEKQAELPLGAESLILAFNDECWTEVFDATGKRIAFGLYKNGRVLMLSGAAPFQLKLGDPSVVEIQYQDQIIEGEFTPGRSAQFSVPLS